MTHVSQGCNINMSTIYFFKMHPIQKRILDLFKESDVIELKLRPIAREIGEEHPQKIKHHLQQLEQNGFIAIDNDSRQIIRIRGDIPEKAFVRLPIMGAANCGKATALADGTIEDFLQISRGLLPPLDISSLYVLRARGDSMNAANINGKNIEDGDYVIVQKSDNAPQNRDLVVSILDSYANIKRFYQRDDEIALISESTRNYPPIFIYEGDAYEIAGKVIKVIKNPKLI